MWSRVPPALLQESADQQVDWPENYFRILQMPDMQGKDN